MPHYVYRCNRCGQFAYPVQYSDGTIDYEKVDELRARDTCYNGCRWKIGIWTEAEVPQEVI